MLANQSVASAVIECSGIGCGPRVAALPQSQGFLLSFVSKITSHIVLWKSDNKQQLKKNIISSKWIAVKKDPEPPNTSRASGQWRGGGGGSPID